MLVTNAVDDARHRDGSSLRWQLHHVARAERRCRLGRRIGLEGHGPQCPESRDRAPGEDDLGHRHAASVLGGIPGAGQRRAKSRTSRRCDKAVTATASQRIEAPSSPEGRRSDTGTTEPGGDAYGCGLRTRTPPCTHDGHRPRAGRYPARRCAGREPTCPLATRGHRAPRSPAGRLRAAVDRRRRRVASGRRRSCGRHVWRMRGGAAGCRARSGGRAHGAASTSSMGVDTIALVAMVGSLALGQELAGVVVGLMFSGGARLRTVATARARRELSRADRAGARRSPSCASATGSRRSRSSGRPATSSSSAPARSSRSTGRASATRP